MQPPPPPQAPQRPQHAGAGGGLGQHWVNLPVYVALLAAITTLLVKNAVHQVPEVSLPNCADPGCMASQVKHAPLA
jgi:hypothetical protein